MYSVALITHDIKNKAICSESVETTGPSLVKALLGNPLWRGPYHVSGTGKVWYTVLSVTLPVANKNTRRFRFAQRRPFGHRGNLLGSVSQLSGAEKTPRKTIHPIHCLLLQLHVPHSLHRIPKSAGHTWNCVKLRALPRPPPKNILAGLRLVQHKGHSPTPT